MTDYTFVRKDLIKRTTIFEGVIVAVSPVRIGAGKADFDVATTVRDAVLKDSHGNPYIPGSSWKGVFRSTGEKILRNKNIEVCSGIGDDNCLYKKRKYREFENAIGYNNVNKALEIFWDNTCLNCKLFGTMSVLGAVKFLDSTPIDYKISTRTMVAISRTEGAAAPGALVQVEYVEPGSKFLFKLIGNNLPNYVIGYLLTIMKNIHDGLTQIGGHKSRGFGFVKFEKLKFIDKGEKKIGDEDVKVNNKDVTEAQGDEFFKLLNDFMEAFENAKIPYPKK